VVYRPGKQPGRAAGVCRYVKANADVNRGPWDTTGPGPAGRPRPGERSPRSTRRTRSGAEIGSSEVPTGNGGVTLQRGAETAYLNIW